jgi:arsenate reductase
MFQIFLNHSMPVFRFGSQCSHDRTAQYFWETTMKQSILFICTQNAGRSQMAEGYLRARYGDRYEVCSAGTHPSQVSRKAVFVMQEIGVDISGHHAKSLDEFAGREIDVAVTLCTHAQAVCPVFPWAKETLHQGFPDPGTFSGTDEEIIEQVRGVRDEIILWIDSRFGKAAVHPEPGF